MSEFNLDSVLRTNEHLGSITKYALAVDLYMNAAWYEKMLEAFETELFERGFRFCHKSADDDFYKVYLKTTTKIELGEIIMLARARHLSPGEPISEIRERISIHRGDGVALVWVDGFIDALEQKGLYLAHSDNLPPFTKPPAESVGAVPQKPRTEGESRSSWKVWSSLAVISLLMGGLAFAAPSIIEKLKHHDFELGEWGTDSFPALQAFPKIEVATPRAYQYPAVMRDWCSGDEVFCTSMSTGNLKEALRGMISAIPQSDVKQFKVRFSVESVADYEDSN